MSNSVNGVLALSQWEVPQAIYNHGLNLVIVNVCKNIIEVETFFTYFKKCISKKLVDKQYNHNLLN